ncbi:MAG: hypothetical protein OXN86_10755 [Chloroflexota bacterium]|nr:hypothetical protein [Chloroflexota bacterium]
MPIPPQRRRRAVNAHFLTQRGFDQDKIALLFEVSPDTVRSDLQLVETHWSELAAALADDLLLQSLQLLQSRLILALKHDPVTDNADRLTPVDYLRARDARETQFSALSREIRRTVQDVHRRAEQRVDQPELFEDLADEAQEPAETTPELSKTDHPDSTISSPEQEIVRSEASEEKTPPETDQTDQADEIDPVIIAAVQRYRQLKGRPQAEILEFLDQLTDPNRQEPPIYAETAA